MAACEKCWRDAALKALLCGTGQIEEYRNLLKERKEKPCTIAEQKGEH